MTGAAAEAPGIHLYVLTVATQLTIHIFMKLSHLLLASALALPLAAQAVPAYPGLIPAVLADGTRVMIQNHGDEFCHYTTDEAGYLLTATPSGLSYELAAGQKVMATPELLQARFQAAAPLRAAADQHRMAGLDSQGRSTFPTLGEKHFLIALVQFPDRPFTNENIQQTMDDMLNKEGWDYNGRANGSMRDYYIEASHGKFTPHFDVTAPITVTGSYKSYYNGNGGSCVGMVKEVTEALKNDQNVDFSKYDVDNDGNVDAIIIFYAGYGSADSSDSMAIWPHQSDISYIGLAYDGKTIGTYCCFNELKGYRNDGTLAGIGTTIHEFNHVMGLPDLYDPNMNNGGGIRSTPGDWSVMDSGPYHNDGMTPPLTSGYESWVYNWLDYEPVEQAKHYSLASRYDGGAIIKIPVVKKDGNNVANEYFLLESRARKGFDAYLPGEGMLIWHIDYNKSTWNSNKVNTQESRKRCFIVSADGSANYWLGNKYAASAKAAWPADKDYLTPDTDITLNNYSLLAASKTGDSFITSMAYDRNTGISEFDYNVYTETPEEATVLNMPRRCASQSGNPTNYLQFTWEPVEGATGYLLTVWRLNSSGKAYYEENLNERNVGTEPCYNLGAALTNTKMGMEYHATVRVVKGIPAKDTSNEVVFVPKELEVTGVQNIAQDGTDAPILGGHGAILAPEGAQVYNLQGQQVDRTGLEPGIYIVRYGARTAKVRVL